MRKPFILKGRKNFQELLLKGKRISNSAVTLFFKSVTNHSAKELQIPNVTKGIAKKGTGTLNDGDETLRIGILVGKKYGTAVERNIAKRRVREIIRSLIPILSKGNYIIIRPTIQFKQYAFDEAKREIVKLLQKAGLVKND
ncbi:MAG: ribonuclease P protein component [Spirochaetes bacterium]|nr:ribonuclease P protein component [Spirochaetota bacterium]